MNLTLLKGASLLGVFWGEFVRREPAHWMEGVAEMLSWIKEKKLNPLISKTYRLDEAGHALTDMAARKVTGKIVIVP